MLDPVLVRRLVFPALGVLVSNMLCGRISLLTAYLTDLSHVVAPPRTKACGEELIYPLVPVPRKMRFER